MKVLLVSILGFKEEHFFWFLLILALILICLFPVPYLHDFIIGIIKSILDFIGVGISNAG